MTPHSNPYYLENKCLTLLKIYDVVGDVIDDGIFEKQSYIDKLLRFQTEIYHRSRKGCFNQIYQTHVNRKDTSRLNGEPFTSEELKNINAGQVRPTLTVTDEKLIAAFTTA